MPNGREPALPSTALDYLALVRAKEETTGLAILDPSDREWLDRLINEYETDGATAALLRRAHTFLVKYRETNSHGGVLDANEREQLDRILDEPERAQRQPRTSFRWPSIRIGWIATAVLVVLALVVIVVVHDRIASEQTGSPTGTAQQQHPPAQQVAPGSTDLQNLRQDWAPWSELTPSDQQPQTGQPGLLLLENGGYFVSKWTISTNPPANKSQWQQDISGDVTNVDVHVTPNGTGYADITDSVDYPYIVGIDQPFIESNNPNTVLRVDDLGNVWFMTLAEATAARQPLKSSK
jgi:hypothetical protein